VNGHLCQHKDCKRTDATPIVQTLYSENLEFKDERTYYFCREHREQLHSLKGSSTLPPVEWLDDDERVEDSDPPYWLYDERRHRA
jgi:hypothetical protein